MLHFAAVPTSQQTTDIVTNPAHWSVLMTNPKLAKLLTAATKVSSSFTNWNPKLTIKQKICSIISYSVYLSLFLRTNRLPSDRKPEIDHF